MKNNVFVFSILATTMLVGCGGKFDATSLSNVSSQGSSSDSQNVQEVTLSNKLLTDIGLGFSTQAASALSGIKLSDAQIQALLTSAAEAVANSGLSNSKDINALMPVIVQAITSGLSGQVSLNETQMASLISGVGQLALDAVLKNNNGLLSNALVKEIAGILFKNLSVNGISNAAFVEVSGVIMNALTDFLKAKGFQVDAINSLADAVVAGAMLAVDKLEINDFLKSQIKALLEYLITKL